jgi:hypothetical protein
MCHRVDILRPSSRASIRCPIGARRMVDAAWVVVAPAAKVDAVKQGFGTFNKLLVMTTHRRTR